VKCKDRIKEIKNYAKFGEWSTVIDCESGKEWKVKKTGKNVMKIPISALNRLHEAKYAFPFDPSIYKY